MGNYCFLATATFLATTLVSGVSAQAPTTAQFQQALEAHLQKLKPTGTTVRTVRFEDVRPGMGCVLERNGKYTDVNGERGGNYSCNAGASTITFRGGFLGGQTGKNVLTTGFNITSTSSCEPWR